MLDVFCSSPFYRRAFTSQSATRRRFLALFLLIVLPFAGASAAQSPENADCNAPAPRPMTSVSLPGDPFGIITTQDGCWLFVSITNAPRMHGIALLRRAGGAIHLQRVIPLKAAPNGAVMTHDGKLLIVADSDYLAFLDVSRMIEGAEDPVIGYIGYGHNPGIFYVNVTPDDKVLFASNENRGTITVIDLAKARESGFNASSIIGNIPAGEGPKALTFSTDGRWLYGTVQIAPSDWKWPIECKLEGEDPPTTEPQMPAGAVVVIDVSRARRARSDSIIANVPAGCAPVRLALSPDGTTMWVSARNGNSVLAFDTSKLLSDRKHAMLAAIPVGSAPVGVMVTADGANVVVANSTRFGPAANRAQTLTIIDAASVRSGKPAILGTVSTGAFPRELAPSPDGKTLFVSNFLSNTLEAIDLQRLPTILSH